VNIYSHIRRGHEALSDMRAGQVDRMWKQEMRTELYLVSVLESGNL
jgi:hypothetical protein